jgi:hypothetical protein
MVRFGNREPLEHSGAVPGQRAVLCNRHCGTRSVLPGRSFGCAELLEHGLPSTRLQLLRRGMQAGDDLRLPAKLCRGERLAQEVLIARQDQVGTCKVGVPRDEARIKFLRSRLDSKTDPGLVRHDCPIARVKLARARWISVTAHSRRGHRARWHTSGRPWLRWDQVAGRS